MATEWANRFDADVRIHPDDTAETESAPLQDTFFPNVDFSHRIYSLLLDGKNHLAPVTAPKRILNLGNKTSSWVHELATEHPNAEVLAWNPTPIDHRGRTEHPTNIRFETKDIEAKDSFQPNHYDFIFSRDVYPLVNNWDTYLQNIHTSLAPGGWAEVIEWEIGVGCDDDSFSEATASRQFHSALIEKLQASGKDINIAEKLRGNLERHGFTNIQERVAKVPMSEWPKDPQFKELGSATLGSTYLLYDYAHGIMGLSPEDAKAFVARCRGELANRSVHVYARIHFLTAQKPTA